MDLKVCGGPRRPAAVSSVGLENICWDCSDNAADLAFTERL